MFSTIQILSVTGWNMQKFDCFLGFCMEIPLRDGKYWTINLFRVQKRFLVFRMFFWWYNNVTWDLLHTAVSYNLVYLASMSILGTPPGATWKIKFFIIAQLYGNSMLAIVSWALRRSHPQEWMKENDCSEYSKWCVGVLRVLAASWWWCMLAWYQPSPYLQHPLPSPLPSFWKVWGRVPFSEGSLVAIQINPNFSAYVILNYFGRKELNASPPSILCYLYLTPSEIKKYGSEKKKKSLFVFYCIFFLAFNTITLIFSTVFWKVA